MTAVQIDSLTLGYPSGIIGVNDLSLQVRQGEIFGLLGLNGAGKSSLIKAIATLMRPSVGQVRIFGLDSCKQAAAVKKIIGVMPQENNLDAHLSVRQNLLFHCRYAGIPAKDAVPRVDTWLSILDLTSKAGETVLHLSGGSKRKVMLAKAFITAPELLVLDEPSSGLDPGVRSSFWEQVRIFRAQGGTVFLSTHYLEEAEALCDRVGILHRGQLVKSIGITPETTRFTPGTLVEAFEAATGEVR